MRTRTLQARVVLAASASVMLALAAACGSSQETPASGAAGNVAGADGGAVGAAAGERAEAAGRGGSTVGTGESGRGGTTSTSNPDPRDGAAEPTERDAGTDSSSDADDAECVVAMRLSVCCPEYVPVTRAQLEAADGCLVELPVGPVFGTDVTRRCQTSSCVGVSCAPAAPPSRIAVSDGDGGCRYGDECQRDEDCILGSATSGCCDCPKSLPAALLEQNPCIQRPGEPYPTSDRCIACTAPVQCGMCVPPADPHCSIRDSFSICE